MLLRFGAVDYACAVYVNGQQAGTHTGGYTPFALDITTLLHDGENDLCLRVQDDPDCTQPRVKQYWDRGLMGCWYTPVSGIWQTVYLEAVGDYAMRFIHVTPDIDRHMFTAEIALDRQPRVALEAELTVSFGGKVRQSVRVSVCDRIVRVPVEMIVRGALDLFELWAPGHPALYDLRVRLLRDGVAVDQVDTYFGMRKIERRGGRIYLNNCPLYQKRILDQGYWPDSLITPPSDEAIRLDLQYTLDFGYNGARKHQKLEDPRYYYWADKMGVLVWGEVPSPYDFSDDTVRDLTETMLSFIERDFNHPCIITWVPLNESWGVRQIYADKRQQAAGRRGGLHGHGVRRHCLHKHRHPGQDGRHADLGLPQQGDGRGSVLRTLQGRDRRRARDSILPGLLLHPADRCHAGNQRSVDPRSQAQDGCRARARDQSGCSGQNQSAHLTKAMIPSG